MRYRNRFPSSDLPQSTIRDFSGGLNAADNEYNLAPKFATRLTNMLVGDDGSLSTRPPILGFANFHATIGSNNSAVVAADWGKYNAPLTIGASAAISTTNAEKYVTINFDAAHGLVSGNWIKGISTVTTGSLGNIPYTEFNTAQWRCVEYVDATTVRVRTDTAANAAASTSTVAATVYCNKIALMLPQNELRLGIVGGWYFQNFLVVVDRVGVVYAVAADGTVSIIFNDTIAKSLSGAPRGWRPLADNGPLVDRVSAVLYKSSLIISNGVDKPLDVTENGGTLSVEYLVDAGTSSNANTPIGLYSTVLNQYVCIAGDPQEPNTVHIGAVGTKGTFLNDPAPNDAVKLFVDEYTETYDNEITGIGTYRGRLIVFMQNSALVFTLGTYDSNGVHTPQFVETLYDVGCASPRSVRKIGDELFAIDQAGVNSLRQSRFINSIEPSRASDLIRNDVLRSLDDASTAFLLNDVFSQVNRRERTLVTRLSRVNTSFQLGDGTSLAFVKGSATVEIAMPTVRDVRIGDTVTLFDFNTDKGITLTPEDAHRQYTITGVGFDRRTFFIEADDEATDSGLYSASVSHDEKIFITNESTANIRERKDRIIVLKVVPTAKLFAWQEFSDVERFGELRSAIVTELNNFFWVYDYHIMLEGRDFHTKFLDGEGFLGQNIHDEALVNSDGARVYRPNGVVFDPVEPTTPRYPTGYEVVDPPGTVTTELAEFTEFAGFPIKFDFETPWIDFNDRQRIKETAFVSLDTTGEGRFTLEAYVDDVYADEWGMRQPALSLTFDAGSLKYHHVFREVQNGVWVITNGLLISTPTTFLTAAPETLDQDIRKASNQLLHAFPCRFKMLKLRIHGDTTEGPVKIIGISLYNRQGKMVGL